MKLLRHLRACPSQPYIALRSFTRCFRPELARVWAVDGKSTPVTKINIVLLIGDALRQTYSCKSMTIKRTFEELQKPTALNGYILRVTFLVYKMYIWKFS